jgi:hypothetical protein
MSGIVLAFKCRADLSRQVATTSRPSTVASLRDKVQRLANVPPDHLAFVEQSVEDILAVIDEIESERSGEWP